MKLTVFSHKPCWVSGRSPSGYSTDGGFPFQMAALSELFAATRLVVPCSSDPNPDGESALTGRNVMVVPLAPLKGRGFQRKLYVMVWLLRHAPVLVREAAAADAIHAPIPGDVGSIGMLLALLLRKPLLVRHCGNWFVQTTAAERFWKWSMIRFAGGRNVMIATGGAADPPARSNPNVRWIFSTSLTREQLARYAVRHEHPGSGRWKLVIACRQDHKKGTGVLIRSLPEILKSCPAATIDVIGGGPDLAEFEALAAQLGVEQQVKFWGKLEHSEVMRILRQSDLFCYPTRASEGFPKVVLEAMACGLPVITTRVSVLPQLMSGGAGLLLDDVSPPSLAAAVCACLQSAEGYRVMSEKALETAAQFSLERWRNEIGGLLRTAWGTI